MNRLYVVALIALGFIPNMASAVDIKNIRPCWGPFGATRFDAKCLPGDILNIAYEIEGLALDPKTKKFSYDTTLEMLDGSGKVLFKKPTPAVAVPELGGTTMPGDLFVTLGDKQAPGKYSIRLTINDKVASAGKAFKYDFEVLPEAVGFIQVSAPAVGFTGQFHAPQFLLVNLTLDAKTKLPDAVVTINILNDKGKPVSEPAKMVLKTADSLPEGTDLEKENVIPVRHPVYLNRTGVYTIEIVANDKSGKKESKLSYPLTVLDVGSFANK